MVLGAIIGGIGALIGGLAGLGGLFMQGEANQMNADIAAKQLEYAKEAKELDLKMNQQNIESQEKINQANIDNQNMLNATMRAREDNAVQRRAADLQAAGINPILAGGGAADAGAGVMANVQAPIADTTIGQAYAQNTAHALRGLMESNTAYAEGTQRSLQGAVEGFSKAAETISKISKTKLEKDLLKAQIENTQKNTQKQAQEILESQGKVEKMVEEMNLTKEQRNWVREQITTEPFKRALIQAQTEEQRENIKAIQQKILNLGEEQRTMIMEQAKKLQEISLSKTTERKIQQEVVNLILDGDLKRFQNNMKELDKVTETSKAYVDMFSDLMSSIFGRIKK